MYDYIIFGGTTEGHLLYEYCIKLDVSVLMCVATDYGKQILMQSHSKIIQSDFQKINAGRLDELQIQELLENEKPKCVFDATHPYAKVVSANVKEACLLTKSIYYRISRDCCHTINYDKCFYFENMKEIIFFLNDHAGNILITTGSKELSEFANLESFQERIYARVLPVPDILNDAIKLGIDRRHLIGMQGPFGEEINYAFIKEFDIKWLVTKESGIQGGFPEKVQAVKRADIGILVIKRPLENQGISEKEAEILIGEG